MSHENPLQVKNSTNFHDINLWPFFSIAILIKHHVFIMQQFINTAELPADPDIRITRKLFHDTKITGGGGVLIKDLKKGMLCTLESEKSVSEDLLIEPKEISSRESQKNHQKGKYMKISKKRISTSLLSCLKRILLPPVCKKMIDYKYRKLVDRPAGSKSSKLK